jgi:hypothetical protein
MAKRGTNAYQKSKYQSHFTIAEKNKAKKKKKYFSDKLKSLHKRYPENKYELIETKNKKGFDIEHIKLTSGKKYKKRRQNSG